MKYICTRLSICFGTLVSFPKMEVHISSSQKAQPRSHKFRCKPRSTPGQYPNLDLNFTSSSLARSEKTGRQDSTTITLCDSNNTSQVALPRFNDCISLSPPGISTPRFARPAVKTSVTLHTTSYIVPCYVNQQGCQSLRHRSP